MEGIEDEDAVWGGDLGEGELGLVGMLADEFGVEAEDAGLADFVVEGVGVGGVGDESAVVVGGWAGVSRAPVRAWGGHGGRG